MNAPTPIDQPLVPAAAWYTSPVQVNIVAAGISQAVSIVLRLVQLFGYEIKIGAADVDAIGANLAQLLVLGFLVVAWWKRQRSQLAPLAMTAKRAEDMTKVNPPLLQTDPTKVK